MKLYNYGFRNIFTYWTSFVILNKINNPTLSTSMQPVVRPKIRSNDELKPLKKITISVQTIIVFASSLWRLIKVMRTSKFGNWFY